MHKFWPSPTNEGENMRGMLFTIFCLLVATAMAAQTDPMIKACAKYSSTRVSTASVSCLAYIEGFTDGLIMSQHNNKTFCIPDNATAVSIAVVVQSTMEKKEPPSNVAPFSVILVDALGRNFPCRH